MSVTERFGDITPYTPLPVKEAKQCKEQELVVVNSCAWQQASSAGTLLVACAPAGAPADSGAGGEAAAPTVLEIWTYPRTENDAEFVYKPMMEKFAAEHPDIKPVVDVQPWGGRREKLYAAAAAGHRRTSGMPPPILFPPTSRRM